MINRLHIITKTSKGEEALLKLLEEDKKENLSNRIKINRQFERKIINTNPLVYEAKATDKLKEDLRTGLSRIAHLVTGISLETNVDMFMTQLKDNQIQNMKKNGAVKRIDFDVELYEVDEESTYPISEGDILNKVLGY